jgi:hypothetical protein
MRPRLLVAVFLLALVAGCAADPQVSTVSSVGSPSPHQHTASEPPAQPLRDGERFVDLRMTAPFTPRPPRGGTDEYRCFLLDPQLSAPAYLTGSQFLPQNAAVVHHAIVFRVDGAEVEQAAAADDGGKGWTCFGGTGLGRGVAGLGGGGSWVAAWAPGTGETLATAGTGYKLEAGSRLIMQVHYNLLGLNGDTPADQSGLRLRLVEGSAEIDPLYTTLLPAPVELPCTPQESGPLCDRSAALRDVARRFGAASGLAPEGLAYLCNRGQVPAPGPTQTCDIRVRGRGTVYAVAGHMHLLGRSIKVELNPGTPRAQTLLDVPVYDFDNQGARELATPVTVQAGDTYRVTCTHDAALRSQLPALQGLPARYVVWGDGTSDEMCLGVVAWSRG